MSAGISATQRVAVITGGAGGIGRAIAARLQRDGLRVALWDLDERAAHEAAAELAELADGAPRAALGVHVDVTDEKSVTAAMQTTVAHFGACHVLINSAGTTGPIAPVADSELAAWQRCIDVNLRSVFLCSRAAVAPMLAAGFGRIVNLASIAGKEGNPSMSAYSAAKAGVIAFTKSMGKELALTPVRVNCIAPAVIDTPLLQQMTPAALAASLAKIPMQRAGTAGEVAALAAWLASDECSFSSGATFDLSGGRATY
ncbi:SDR family oxidoreductase [Paraburkholderia sp. MMS20-SJTR3]|uniref:SDR family oxidoreductase n=1 Tax=Paraburkholderia sejongensis TaxID=2886946 RepID=A0ABS8JRW6_9BURK|nr:SDR family NAD(P)-dependent oxidoreductase [Paraburkholderia sp. MMS20-SJTR3]MCC8392648.1 SDR family oxidoreductase [Paraburkholderia sp. MMS20-SJTR3]